MSDTDSFISEVTEEVRRDQLFAYFKRYGWIAALAVVAIVGTAAWNEWSKAQAQAQAQALGDTLLDAMDTPDAAARIGALTQAGVTGPAEVVAGMLLAAEQQAADDIPAALATLQGIADIEGLSPIYRDLAQIKALIVGAGLTDESTRREGLQALAVPGRPFRMSALEQLAIATLADGDKAASIAAFQALIDDAEASQGLRERAQGMIVALGGELPVATTDGVAPSGN